MDIKAILISGRGHGGPSAILVGTGVLLPRLTAGRLHIQTGNIPQLPGPMLLSTKMHSMMLRLPALSKRSEHGRTLPQFHMPAMLALAPLKLS